MHLVLRTGKMWSLGNMMYESSFCARCLTATEESALQQRLLCMLQAEDGAVFGVASHDLHTCSSAPEPRDTSSGEPRMQLDLE